MPTPADAPRTPFMEERRRSIMEQLNDNESVLVSELAERFGVSPATVRSDIRALEAEGRLERTHGGAIAISPNHPTEMEIDARRTVNRRQKMRIGRRAAQLVEDGDFILVDSGTTTQAFVDELVGRRALTILTNDLRIASMAETTLRDANVIMIGGAVRTGFHTTQGADAIDMLRRYAAPRLFSCCDTLTLERGFSTYTTEQAAIKRTMIEQAQQCIMLMDSSKWGLNAPVRCADITDVDIIVTDSGLPAEAAEAIQSVPGGPQLIVA